MKNNNNFSPAAVYENAKLCKEQIFLPPGYLVRKIKESQEFISGLTKLMVKYILVLRWI